MTFDVGALVRARGREWVVLPKPNHDPDMLLLRPLGGTEHEITGICPLLEQVEPATFDLPDPDLHMGNNLSCGLLRDAMRLGFRSGAGPFRSIARIAIDPRPYQLVPLLMALKLDPVRILIADDVGIGKTVEACLVARELIDRGEVGGLVVLCPPHLAEQWQKALAEQFNIDAALVLSGTASRLERTCRQGESLFERYPFTVVSTDYIKTDHRRHEFLRTCPDLVLVDEAHTCSSDRTRSGVGQQRHELLRELVNPARKDGASRHLVLVTATPHSGNEETFRSLLALLDQKFADLPEDLSGEANRHHREALARHFVQRRRGDIEDYLDTETLFPDREIAEEHYTLTPEYLKFFKNVLAYCRESMQKEGLEQREKRVQWWSVLALLRSLSSSPMAAAETLRNRSGAADGKTEKEVDEEGRRTVLDLDEESAEGIDVVPGSETGEEDPGRRRRLRELAREAEALAGRHDAKLGNAANLVQRFIDDGYSPILFCRFIPTVDYVADFLRKKLGDQGVVVEAITGLLPPEERGYRIDELGKHEKRVLVCTDCLSEGINLQDIFDAVMHYDLSWNPTRHEQREGRVDRYGQPEEKVRTLTYFGQDNPVDGIVLQVLLRKHRTIHKQLGITVSVPMDTKIIEDAIVEGLLLRENIFTTQLSFEFLGHIHEAADIQWDRAVERESRSRALFAQNQMRKEINVEVRDELNEVRRAIGSDADVRHFTSTAFQALKAVVSGDEPLRINLRETSQALKDAVGKDAVGEKEEILVTFSGQPRRDTLLLTRTHPVVEGLAAHVMETALEPNPSPDNPAPARRSGVVRTHAVEQRTTLLLLRLRFHVVNQGRDGVERPLLAEDLILAAFTGSPDRAEWLTIEGAEALLNIESDANINPDQARTHIQRVLDGFDNLRPRLDELAEERGGGLFEAHKRVRKVAGSGIRALKVDVHKPGDVLGVYIYLPATLGEIE